MSKVVGVHGIAQQYRGPNYLATQWLPSLQDGLKFAGGSFAEHDFTMAFYGNMFLGQGEMGGGFPPFSISDLDEPEEAALLELLWREAARVDPNVPDPDPDPAAPPAMGRTPQWLQHGLNALSQSAFFAGLAQRAMIGAMKQVHLYFTDSKVRARAIKSVSDVVTDETRVVIGHSLGSVVAYEALAANPEWPVHTLITLGSPLGIRNLIFDRLAPLPVNGRGARPAGLQAWVNAAAPGDIVALVKALASRFDGVVDRLVDTGAEAHDVRPYLTNVQVGQAVLSGLG